MAERVTVTGLEDVLKKLKRLEPKLRQQAVKKASSENIKKFKVSIQSKAPVKTGALKRGFAIKQIPARLRDIIGSDLYIRHGKKRTKSQKLKNEDPFYWRFIEYGTKYIKARHFIKKAYDNKKSSVQASFKNDIIKWINKLNV